ncbi:sporulation-specific protein 22 [Tilletia horrida]|uniref:Protein ZIP4 homolog n=1 Tax=Tilletia horrida TaxID=155126 RepID=A0AAN6GK13_9BASI|nr:sporulation-specific protein 22 [Tilletia horrida]
MTFSALFECVKDKLSLEHHTNTIVRSALAEISNSAPALQGKIDQKAADTLDEHGVLLWNASITLRHLSEGDSAADSFVADVRLAAVCLLDAGSTTVRLVMAYSSLLSLLSTTGKKDFGTILARANELVSSLPTADERANKKLAERLDEVRRAFSQYEDAQVQMLALLDELPASALHISRAEPVWRRSFRLGQHFLTVLPEETADTWRDSELLKLSEQSIHDCQKAIKWLQKGIALQERSGVVGIPVVKALIQLAYAYFIAGALEKNALASAEAALSEAAKMLQSDGSVNEELNEYIAFMRFRVTCRHGSDADLTRALEQLCATLTFSEASTSQLLDFITNGPKRLLCLGFRIIIRAMIKSEQADVQQHLTSVLLRAIYLVTEPSSLAQLDGILDDVANSKLSLSQDAVCAAQMMIWRKGDVLYKKEMFELAADVHMIAVHRVFAGMPDNVAKSARRIAVCYLALHQPEAAQACIELCPEPYRAHASTQLCSFLAAVQMSNEDDALRAFQALVRAPDLEPAILVVEEAQKANMEKALYAGLETLLDAVKVDTVLEANVDILTLHRTLVCIFLPPENGAEWSDVNAAQLQTYLRQALKAVASRMDTDDNARKHAEWLWKQAYNAGITASHTKDASRAAGIFDAAFDLMEERHRFTGEPPDQAIVVACWCAKFASVEVAAGSILEIEDASERQVMYEELQRQFALAEKLRKAAHAVDAEAAPEEAEVSAAPVDKLFIQLLKDFEQRLVAVPFKVVEALVHALSAQTELEVPVQVEVQALELLLKRYQLDNSNKTLDRTLRYHRFVLMLLLEDEHFGQKEYRRKALEGFVAVRKALAEAESGGMKEFPVDDVMWFLAQAWQKGMELSLMAKVEQAAVLTELALSMSRFVPFPEATKRKMEAQYESLLRRVSSARQEHPFPTLK